MANWFVIITTPQGERKAATDLRRAGLRVYLPKRSYLRPGKVGRYRATREKTVYRPLWTGYLLVRFPMPGTPPFALVRGCQGVHDFLKWTNKHGEWEPVPIAEKVVLAFMRRQRNRDYDGVLAERTARELRRSQFRKGGLVRVNDGPFAQFLARVEKLHGDTAHILVNIFGRETTLVVDDFVDQLEPLAKSKAAA